MDKIVKSIIGLLLITTIAAQAQNIKGKVCLEKDKSPVSFASVGLCQLPDSSIVTGVITLTDGGYLLEKVKPGNYYVKVFFLGYKRDGKQVTVEQGKTEITVDTIFLAESTTSLNEITVTGERLKGKEMVDRTVYNVPSVIAKASSNGYDILKKIPAVNVDFQNNITLNGSSNFIIQVDGRQRDREFLAKLLPSDIESIEIISNPSGKYEGNIDGVINIILKKEARYGMNGNIALSSKPIGKPTNTLSGSLDYGLGKITFYITAFTFEQRLNISTTNLTDFLTLDSTTNMSGKGRIKVGQTNVNAGFDYYMNDKNNMSFNVSFKPTWQTTAIGSNTLLFKGADPLSYITSITDNNSQSTETTTSLFYKKTFKKPVEEFTAEASYYIFNSNDAGKFTNDRFRYSTDSALYSYGRLEKNLNKRDYLSTKLNYVYPLGMSAKLEAGYQLYYQQMSYDFNIDNKESNNLFEYKEFRNSLYGGITLNLKKFGFQTMLRVENSHIMADSVTQPNYYCLLPSANIQYKFSASNNLKLTYNRRINRPGINDMDPYYKIGQNYDITVGNPDLKPDYRDRLQMTYTLNMGSNYLSPYIYQEYYTGKIGREYEVVLSDISNTWTTKTKPYNLLSGYESGGGLNAMLWFVNINARVFSGHINEYKNLSTFIPSRDYFSYAVTGYAFAQLDKKKTLTAILYLSYSGVNVNAQSKTYSLPIYGIGAQKVLKDHNFGIFWILPFSKEVEYSRTETTTNAFTSRNTVGIDLSNYIQFSYSYKFNKGKNVKKVGHKVDVESDSKGQIIGQ
jgi:hypothetical protein